MAKERQVSPPRLTQPTQDAAIGIIPARYGSSRVPAKALADLGGQTMVERVYKKALEATTLERVIVATDDHRIADVIAPIGEAVMTSPDHASGSDRVAEVARGLEAGIIVNIQGDLPLLDPTVVDKLVERLRADPSLGMATAAVSIDSETELKDPAVVKVVTDESGHALYFSRSPIPYDRDQPGAVRGALHHIGIYAYRRDTLLRFADLAPTRLERTEKLEQLRALENGIKIGVVEVAISGHIEVDTAEDLDAVREALAELAEIEEPGIYD
ncbi:MAG: 3-deoxy-manno-octulosonate cytidylyltransferase [Deltaproteobacteria bacterium]